MEENKTGTIAEATPELDKEQALDQNPESDQGQPSDIERDPTQIPVKFIGKSAIDVIQSYEEVERRLGQVSSEMAQEKKQREEAEERYRQLERQYQSPAGQQVPAAPVQPEMELDPFEAFEDKFQDNPSKAVKDVLVAQREADRAQQKKEYLQRQAQEAALYNQKQLAENPDYARLSPKMQDALNRYQGLINPDAAASPQALEALHYIARGMDIGYYEAQAIERAKKDGLTLREEKQQASSESSYTSSPEDTKAFKDLSLKEMEQTLGIEED